MANVHVCCVLGAQEYVQARRVQQERLLRLVARQAGPGGGGRPLFVCGDFNQEHDAVFKLFPGGGGAYATGQEQATPRRGAKAQKLAQPKLDGPGGWAAHCRSLWHEARCGAASGPQPDPKHGWPHGSYHGWLFTELRNQNRLIDWILVTSSGGAAGGSTFESGHGAHGCSVEVHGAELAIGHTRWRPTEPPQPCGPWSNAARVEALRLGGERRDPRRARQCSFPADHFPVLAAVTLYRRQ